MNTTTTAGEITPVEAAALPAIDARVYADTMEEIDRIQNTGFIEIATVARLALAKLETPDGYRNLDWIARAFELIECRAEDSRAMASNWAADVSCRFEDVAHDRRQAAQRAAREGSDNQRQAAG
ncbi:MAG: hypothetical protein IPG93_04350 [Burkholderiales bacterium]|nr:hypothetical protein [Burkholderiales bacterium]